MTPSTLSVDLVNQTSSNTVYCYITGQAINHNNALVLLEADGHTLYYPSSPSATGTPLATACAIPLGAPGSTRRVTIPQIAGGRIWFSVDSKLTFLLNPGPGLVEPSSTNLSDPNINILWDFCEFTFNSAQMFINISYVDFVSVPIALDLASASGTNQHVSGMASNGLTTVVDRLNAQHAIDHAGWSSLVYSHGGRPLRVLSPNNGKALNAALLNGYWEPYVNEVWNKYASTPLTINTQAAAGNVRGTVANGRLTFPGGNSFGKPTSTDIFGNSTGPFNTAGASPEALAIIPRLAAAFNRSTILAHAQEPDGVHAPDYYRISPTNHYARVVHGANLDQRGYAFPYDDVTPDGGQGVAGTASDGNPSLLTVTVGGRNAHA
ncbi:MAG: hypothetical protein M1828_006325 [Chrysothrix sp. TS-e1954]|nr:MAG: hypothetical protein M1828_006325 [Chrysothrix sp. TS-e1954]